MYALPRPVERRPFHMKAEDAWNFQAGLGNCSQMLDYLASVADEGRQAARGPPFAVRLDDAPYAGFRGLVIEKNASATVHLYVYEPRSKNCVCGKADGGTRLLLAAAD